MKTLAALIAVVLATAAAARPADACGGYGSFAAPVARETAVGSLPELRRDDRGRLHLFLAYPKFTISGEFIYMHDFVVVHDQSLRRLERALAGSRELVVTVEEVKPGLWRVRGWTTRSGSRR